MGQAGYILRFVDVVLILLFGFISISSIEPSIIEPPESTETPVMPPDREAIIYVGIQYDGTFLVEDESRVIDSVPALRSFLLEKVQEVGDRPLKVRLRSSRVAPIRYLMDAAGLCDELGIRKSIEVKVNASR